MSYKALYRKYRPKTFDDVIGQEYIIETLKNIISTDKVSHAYLFAGPRGTGKTSVAHVFASEINRTASGNIELNSLDIIEIDAASNNGVAEVRSLIEASKYSPSKSKYKIYIIDEVHMLTKGAFNALLKTLEEPPAHVIFIFATTEPEKMPITILSRLQRFNFKQISKKIISNQLRKVLSTEKIEVDEEAINLISTIASGGMRDALSIADQSAAFGNGKISFDDVSKVFGLTSTSNQIKLINLIYANKTNELLILINQFIDEGVNIERLSSSLISATRDFIVYQKTKANELMNYLQSEDIHKLNISQSFGYELIDTLMELLAKLKTSMMPKQLFELFLLKATDKMEAHIVEKQETQIFPTKETIIETKTIPTTNLDTINDLPLTTLNKIDLFARDGDNPENNNNPKEVINTDEINLTADIALEEEAQHEEDNLITEKLLDTQEIKLETNLVDQKTEEIDLVSMFSSETENIRIVKSDETPNVDELINLLVQSNKAAAGIAKERLKSIPGLSLNKKYNSYVSLFESIGIISKGDNFVLLISKQDDVVKQIRLDSDRQSLIDFANEVFGEPTRIFAITIEEFEKTKARYSELAKINQLPEAVKVKQPTISEKQKTKEEEYGNNLFGSLFE